jgi:hypothetical protein
VGLRGGVKRLEREAAEGAVLIRQRDGSVRAFDRMDVMGQMYLTQLDDALGRNEAPRSSSDVLDALENATPESRRAVEEMSTGSFYADLEPSTGPVEDLSEP